MELKRYLLKDREKGDYFGEYNKISTWDYNWFFGKDKIGVTGNASTEAECFIGGFLVREKDALDIEPSQVQPIIRRTSDPIGRMSGTEEVYNLIQLIQGQEVTHSYLSSPHENGKAPFILTFSKNAPSSELYNPGKSIPIFIHQAA